MPIDVRPRGAKVVAIGNLLVAGLWALLWAISDTPLPAVLLLPAVAFAIRSVMVRAWVEGDRLHVRNFWRTSVLERAQIAGFAVDDTLGGRSDRRRTVSAALAGGGVRRLSATGRNYRMFPPLWPWPGKRNDADEICERLHDWLRSGA